MTAAAPLGLLLLTSCGRHDAPAHRHIVTSQVMVLPQGTIAALPGSPEEALAKFMASHDAPPRSFRFATDQFTPWSDQLTARTRGSLSTIIQILANYPAARIVLAGYTDNDGSPQANLALSQRRVDRLKQLLVEGGVRRSAVIAVGKGMADPIADNRTAQGRALNRRVELTVIAKP